jgi:hypothetical protein
MAVGRSSGYRARRREAERQRRERTARRGASDQSAGADVPARTSSDHGARRAAAVSCAWCGGAITPRSRGTIPKWCSSGCRRRAWEQGRAAASGRSAVEVVERQVEVRVPVTPTRRDWAPLLSELAPPTGGRPCLRPRPRCTGRGTEICPRGLQPTPVCARPQLRTRVRLSVVTPGRLTLWTLGPAAAPAPRGRNAISSRPAVGTTAGRQRLTDPGHQMLAVHVNACRRAGVLVSSCSPAGPRTGRPTARRTGEGERASSS